MKYFLKLLFLPFYYVFKLLYYILLYGTIFLVCLIGGFILLKLLYELVILYFGTGLDYVLETAEIYKNVADAEMTLAIEQGNNLNWYMYCLLKGFVLFCVLFYSIPSFIICGLVLAASAAEPVYNVRVVNH